MCRRLPSIHPARALRIELLKLDLLMSMKYQLLISIMSLPQVLASSWDCHVHSFDPERFPYKEDRAYTPQPAPLPTLVQNLITKNFMLVQATIERSYEDLLVKLEEFRSATLQFPGVVRGTILAEPGLSTLTDTDFERMHYLGIRCARLHGSYGGSGQDLEWVQGQMTAMAQLDPVLKYGWSISAQLPLEIWAQLRPYILTHPHLSQVTLIADHIGSATPNDSGSPALEDFIDLLRSGKVYVKISALHRRSPANLEAMAPIVSALAEAAPKSLLWGSDWPHVNTKHNDHAEGPLAGVNASHELDLIKSWLSEDEVQDMLVNNPERLFAT